MPRGYQTRTYKDNGAGRRRMDREMNDLGRKGWTVTNTQVGGQGYSAGKTCCLGCTFLPLALLGRKPNLIIVTYERDN